MFLSDINRLVAAHDRYDEARRTALGFGLSNVYLVELRWLNEAARLTGCSMREADKGRCLSISYRGLTFMAPKGVASCR